jgi:demethylmenaquinone methyltransferase/2-methoxy-6-polyprenyl-1,4-benzoquinol methylase
LISEKGRAVREMFGAIAGRYDFLNHFLSGNVDRRWRRVCAEEVRSRLEGARPAILDLGCGTADLALELARDASVTGCDFCHPMLVVGKRKVGRTVELAEADALLLPFRDGTFDAVVSAFVVRNLADLDGGLRETARVLRRGGVLGVLEFALPQSAVFGAAYRFYFSRILPALGRIVSGVDGPYRYLPESVRTFPGPGALSERIGGAGFRGVDYRLLTGGIAALYTATRA